MATSTTTPTPQQASYPLDTLYLYPYYQSQAQYKAATGQDAPPFDPSKPPKGWFDPAALNTTLRNVVYDRVIAYADNGIPARDANGNPMLEALVLLKADAANVNIPLKQTANEAGAGQLEVPVPLRALNDDEELFFDWGGIIKVRNKKLWAAAQNVPFTLQDQQLLEGIAQKLGVTLPS